MEYKSLKKEAKMYFMPILLGSNREAFRLATDIFKKFGMSSLILDSRRSLSDILCPYASFLPLCFGGNDRLLCEELISLAEQAYDRMPILIPLTPQYTHLLEENSELLEKHFVLSTPSAVLKNSPPARMLSDRGYNE